MPISEHYARTIHLHVLKLISLGSTALTQVAPHFFVQRIYRISASTEFEVGYSTSVPCPAYLPCDCDVHADNPIERVALFSAHDASSKFMFLYNALE